MTQESYIFNRALAFRKSEDGGRIYIGLNPPKGLIVENDPHLVGEVLTFFTQPRSLQDAEVYFGDQAPLAKSVFDEFCALGVIRQNFPADSRFDRHHLYFDLFDVLPAQYGKTLQMLRVGLIGCGGIGSTCAMLLAAAGVGHLKISDGDHVEVSNLTRTVLFREDDMGVLKVNAARRQLQLLNSATKVDTLPKMFTDYRNDPTAFHDFFGDCNFLILSADKPKEVHDWANEISLKHGIPHLNAGYVETFGMVGPLVVPAQTACFNCSKLADLEFRSSLDELNPNLQAPSYGPLNAMISSIAVNEVIRFSLNLPTKSTGKTILIDSSNYEITVNKVEPHKDCYCGSHNPSLSRDKFEDLARLYEENRDSTSLNSIVVDPLILTLVKDDPPKRILDVGCGIGTISRTLAERGHHVTATDISESMLAVFRARVTENVRPRLTIIQGDLSRVDPTADFDIILLTLLLDHLDDPTGFLVRILNFCKEETRVIVTVPHPFKDAGFWVKDMTPHGFEYKDFIVTDYFSEGIVAFTRENDAGEIVTTVPRHKRQLSTYLNAISASGFDLVETFEPTPEIDATQSNTSVNFTKGTRVPYFLVFFLAPRRHQ